MDDATAVSVPQRRANLAHVTEDRGRGLAWGVAEPLLERVAPHERHDEQRDSVRRVEVVHPDDIGVIERGAECRFPTEPLAPHPARRDLGREHFDRHDMAERAMAGAEHGTHASRAGEVQHLVALAHRALHVFEGRGLHRCWECMLACRDPH